MATNAMQCFLLNTVFVIIWSTVCNGGNKTITSRDLHDYLFKSDHNIADTIPICNKGDRVNVTVDVALRELVELSEKFQMIRVKIWIRLNWNDCTMTWQPNDFNGQESIIVPYGKIWMPDLALYEGASDEANMPDMKEYHARIKHNGDVNYNFPTIVTSTCRIDVTYFPYDHQNCSLTFSSWVYSGAEVDLGAKSTVADIENFVRHNEWALSSMRSTKRVHYYKCCPEPYPNVIYHLCLARYQKFYLLTLFLPCIIVSLLSILGFLLPPGQGEKISLQITILLTIVVFLLLVQDKLPSSSDTFPYIGIYFSISMILVCLSCVMSGIVMYVFYKGSTRASLPAWAKKIFLDVLRPIVCVRRVSDGMIQDKRDVANTGKCEDQHDFLDDDDTDDSMNLRGDNEKTTDPKLGSLRNVGQSISIKMEQNTKRCRRRDVAKNDWELLALVLDRFFLILYIGFTVGNTSCIYHLMNEGHEEFQIQKEGTHIQWPP